MIVQPVCKTLLPTKGAIGLEVCNIETSMSSIYTSTLIHFSIKQITQFSSILKYFRNLVHSLKKYFMCLIDYPSAEQSTALPCDGTWFGLKSSVHRLYQIAKNSIFYYLLLSTIQTKEYLQFFLEATFNLQVNYAILHL